MDKEDVVGIPELIVRFGQLSLCNEKMLLASWFFIPKVFLL